MTKSHGSVLTIAQLQQEIAEWGAYNFPLVQTHRYWPLLGMLEENGELAEPILIAWLTKLLGKTTHAHLKIEQGIRGRPEKLNAEARDAIADMFIYCAHYCEMRGWDLQNIILTTWDQVKSRDWQKNPKTGGEA